LGGIQGATQVIERLAQVLARYAVWYIGPEQSGQHFPAVRVIGFDGQVGKQCPAPIRLNRDRWRTAECQLKATQQVNRYPAHNNTI
jgi:hypothetical protein